jgi:hypothetical protein
MREYRKNKPIKQKNMDRGNYWLMCSLDHILQNLVFTEIFDFKPVLKNDTQRHLCIRKKCPFLALKIKNNEITAPPIGRDL